MVTRFFGRERELAEIHGVLTDEWGRLVTLRGPGDIGKTRLAIRAAELERHSWDAVCFVSLREINSPELVPQAIATALHLRLDAGDPILQIASYLAEMFPKTLLVLDNLEHLLEAGERVHELLLQLPTLKVIVTSRERLYLEWEWIIDIEGLEVPAGNEIDNAVDSTAVQLFLERARRVFPRFPIRQELSDVITICRLVEGHPLAVELAAAWTGVFSCREILTELESNIEILRQTRKDLTDAHRSIAATFDYTFGQLSKNEQQAFQRFGFFEGGFDRPAAEAVTGATLPVLSALIEKSLVQRRERRLDVHELVRRYALDKLLLDGQDARQTAERMILYFLEYARTFQLQYSRLEQEWGNIGAGMRLAYQYRDHQSLQGYTTALQKPWQVLGRYSDARRAYQLAYEVADSCGDTRASADILREWGGACLEQGDYREAQDHLSRSELLYDAMGDKDGVAHVRLELARVTKELGALDLAEAYLKASRTFLTELGDRPGVAATLYRQASILDVKGEYAPAEQFADEAYRIQTEIGEAAAGLKSLVLLTEIALHANNLETAQERARVAHHAAIQMEDRGAQALIHLAQGEIHTRKGEWSQAEGEVSVSLELLREIGDRKSQAQTIFRLSRIRALQGDWLRSLDLAGQSLEMCRALEDRWGMVFVLEHMGNVQESNGQTADAERFWKEAAQLAAGFQKMHPRRQMLEQRVMGLG